MVAAAANMIHFTVRITDTCLMRRITTAWYRTDTMNNQLAPTTDLNILGDP